MVPLRALGSVLAAAVMVAACGDDGEATPSSSTADATESTASSSTRGATSSTSSTSTTVTTSSSTSTSTSPATSTEATTTATGETDRDGSFYVYVASNDDEVATWSMNPEDGSLTLQGQATTTGTGIGPLAVSPNLSHLYAVTRNSQEVTAFSIDSTTGLLSSVGATDLGFGGVYVSVDPSGGYLLSATFGGDEIASFPIEADGTIDGQAVSRISTTNEPHLIVADPSGQWVFVPHRTPDVVGQYGFDSTTGTLSANTEPTVEAPTGAGPRHLAFHPTQPYVYVANEFSDSVSVYAFDGATGRLTLGETVSTLPDGVPGGDNTCADIHITPDGAHLYVSNRGHDSLAAFAVSGNGSTLTSRGHTETEARPREFEISPRGRYLFAAGRDSNMMASYTRQNDGQLVPGPVYDVGTEPLWVLAVEIPAA